MSETANRLRSVVVKQALHGPGKAGGDARRAAFNNRNVPEGARALIDKVAKAAYKVIDEDITAAKAAGLTEDQLFELVVCAALGQSTRQLDAAMAALDEAERTTP